MCLERGNLWCSSSCPFSFPFIYLLILIALLFLMLYLLLKDTSVKLMNRRIMFLIDNLAVVNGNIRNQKPLFAKCCHKWLSSVPCSLPVTCLDLRLYFWILVYWGPIARPHCQAPHTYPHVLFSGTWSWSDRCCCLCPGNSSGRKLAVTIRLYLQVLPQSFSYLFIHRIIL